MTTRDEMFEQAHKLKGATPEVDTVFPDKSIRPTTMKDYETAEVAKFAPYSPNSGSLPVPPTPVVESEFVVFTEVEKDGFVWHPTFRKGMSPALIKQTILLMETANKEFIATGWKAHERKAGFPAKKAVEFIEGKPCPKCGEKLVKGVGKVAEKCSTNKWDRVTGTATGCDYVSWA